MGIPYHTHEFEIPAATRADIESKSGITDKAVVPANLGTAALADKEEFATKAQGEKAEKAAPETRMIRAGNGLAGGGALSGDITLELDEDIIAVLGRAETQALSAAAAAEAAGQEAAMAGQTAKQALGAAAAAGDVRKAELGALAFKARVAAADIAASGALSADTVLCGDGVWRKPPAGGSSGGSGGAGGGDMRQALYDPNKKQSDIFDMDNMAEGRIAKILTAAERVKLAALPANAVAAAIEVQAGAGLAGGGALTKSVSLRLSEASLAALEQAKKAALKTELGSLAYKSKIALAEIEAGGVCGAARFLRGDGQWAEPQMPPPLPAGMIAPFAGEKAAEGWLICDGSAVSRSQYAALYAAIGLIYGSGNGGSTFNLPDLRGEFIRGFDAGRGLDSGRIFGSAQGDALQNVKGGFSAGSAAPPNTDVFTAASGAFAIGETHVKQRPMNRMNDIAGASPDVNFDLSRAARTADETRPRNIALLYCIKF